MRLTFLIKSKHRSYIFVWSELIQCRHMNICFTLQPITQTVGWITRNTMRGLCCLFYFLFITSPVSHLFTKWCIDFSHWGWDKTDAILQTTFEFQIRFHWKYSLWSSWQCTSIGLDNGLAPNTRQVIIWLNDDPVHRRICVIQPQWVIVSWRLKYYQFVNPHIDLKFDNGKTVKYQENEKTLKSINDAIWQHKCRSTLAQVIVSCRLELNHFLSPGIARRILQEIFFYILWHIYWLYTFRIWITNLNCLPSIVTPSSI